MKEIITSNGETCLVDDEDYDRLCRYGWYCNYNHGGKYAMRTLHHNKIFTKISMHRDVLGLYPGDPGVVDHINHNGLDNRKENLRIGTTETNLMNRKRKPSKSGFVGVFRMEDKNRNKRYMAYITLNRKRRLLGYFHTVEEAIKARDEAAKLLHGEYADLNFPEGEKK